MLSKTMYMSNNKIVPFFGSKLTNLALIFRHSEASKNSNDRMNQRADFRDFVEN